MAVVVPTRDKTAPIRRRGRLSETWMYLRRSKSGMLGLTILVIHLLIALSSPLIVAHDPTDIDASLINKSPSREYPLGTDQFGRDVLTRVLLGGRIALAITLTATVIAVTWGGTLGILLGFLGGRIDEAIMRVVDALLAAPYILFLLLIVSALGSSNSVLIFTLGFFYGIAVVRVARAATLDFVARDFITAARARGERRLTIVLRELLPNVLDILLVEFAMRWSWMLLAFSSLSFLGFGVSPPTPDWGLMIAESRKALQFAPWTAVFPMIALGTLVIGINLAADAVAKALGLDRTQGAPV